MIAEALRYLAELGAKSSGFHSLTTPEGDVLIAKPDGSVDLLEARIPDRKDTLEALDSLIYWISDKSKVEVFVSSKQVECIAGRRVLPTADRARLVLQYSKSWLALIDWITHSKSQTEVVRMLRGPLRGCCSDGLANVFRSIEFRSGVESQRTIKGTGSDSLGRSAHREALSGGQELPDTLALNLPVFDLHEMPTFMVPVAVDVDYDAERIRLLEIGDGLQTAGVAALRWIANQIDNATEAQVYIGSFSQS